MRKLIPLLVLALAAGCSSREADLDRFISQTKQEQPSGVEPLPEIKAHDPYTYSAQELRSPFVPGGAADSSAQSVRPNSNRNREPLEQYSLDTLKMKGTLKISGRHYGLVQARDGIVHRVLPGNYMGQYEGRIISVEPSRINLIEIVPDGLGRFMERPATLSLAE